MNIPDISLPRVVIIGCGFGGLQLAKRLKSSEFQTVLIDKRNYHTFQPLMYQVATAGLEPDSIAYPIRKIFRNKKNFYIRNGEVTKIEADKQRIETSIGPLSYDYLVVATGANNNFFGNVSIQKNGFPMKSLVESLNLRSTLLQSIESAISTDSVTNREKFMNVVIVGGGPTGVELAGALTELRTKDLPKDYPDLDFRHMQIHLVEAGERILSAMSEKSSAQATKYLKKRNVHIWTSTRVTEFDGNMVSTNVDIEIPAKTLIWAAGIQGQFPMGMNVNVQRGNRVPINEFFEVEGLNKVYAIGDVAMMKTESTPNGHPMLGAVAAQMGKRLGKNLNRKVDGKPEKKFKYRDKGSMATVGRNLAVVDLPNFHFAGWFGWMVWLFVHLMLLVGFRNRVLVFVNWIYNYLTFDRSYRLIVRNKNSKEPYESNEN